MTNTHIFQYMMMDLRLRTDSRGRFRSFPDAGKKNGDKMKLENFCDGQHCINFKCALTLLKLSPSFWYQRWNFFDIMDSKANNAIFMSSKSSSRAVNVRLLLSKYAKLNEILNFDVNLLREIPRMFSCKYHLRSVKVKLFMMI